MKVEVSEVPASSFHEYDSYSQEEVTLAEKGSGKPLLYKCDREMLINLDQNIKQEFDALSDVKKFKHIPATKRGGSKLLFSEEEGSKYYVLGAKVPHARGLFYAAPGDPNVEIAIIHLMNRCTEAMKSVLPHDLVKILTHTQKLTGASGIDFGGGRTTEVFSSIAFGMNVFLEVHTDDDAHWCVITIVGQSNEEGEIVGDDAKYSLDDDICCYFCLPEYKASVPLRPGDVLVFNANEPHAVSSRCREDQRFMCVSMYVKSKVVGTNNIETEFTSLQQKALDAELQKFIGTE